MFPTKEDMSAFIAVCYLTLAENAPIIAKSMWDLFEAFKAAGFSEEQAMQLVLQNAQFKFNK